MNREATILGIDIGSVSISTVQISLLRGDVLKSSYLFHEGKIKDCLREILADFDLSNLRGVAVTGSSPDIFTFANSYDTKVSMIRAAKSFYPEMRSLIIIGGEKFGIATFDESGNYKNFRSNSSCAAGTGSFLDQQAKRLAIKDIETFSKIASENKGDVPKIASRCAVFAKTDLIHAQQEGYSLSEICDGLCEGLARNVCDTLFGKEKAASPIVLAGGVSKNQAVLGHLKDIIGTEIYVHELSHVFGALGAAFLLVDDIVNGKAYEFSVSKEHLIKDEVKEKKYYHKPLKLQLSQYPDFSSFKSYLFKPSVNKFAVEVEVDIYRDLSLNDIWDCYLGIDIGSTSTKAVITDSKGDVLTGLYTRTSGRPLEAVQSLFEAIDDIQKNYNCEFIFLGAGTTGSGRKFIGSIINADLALDEITAHARAAYSLDSDVDTIIEIGGQDAKFTTLKNGTVTFSVMNNVCAAGTGSFIEEQAKKLGCPISEYSLVTENVCAPLSSDRCTVFMERDINHYLTEGYSREEVLASVLHSVRENYLTKVAIEKNIGSKIFFQGATAKNRALVAAFEQRLGKPIMVSKFCHVTGALGVALTLIDSAVTNSKFRGIGLYRESIPVETEVCNLCTNSCKIKVAEIDGEKVAFGFLCGRDYDTKHYVDKNISGFDLIKARKKVFASQQKEIRYNFTIGIPESLYLFDETFFWQEFFGNLGIKTVTSSNFRDGVKLGKTLAGAEFCAPVSQLHGHVAYLLQGADYVFLPSYIEEKKRDGALKRNYCYYSQYAPVVIKNGAYFADKERILSPLLKTTLGTLKIKLELTKMLGAVTSGEIGFMQVSAAYDMALKEYKKRKQKLKEEFKKHKRDDINVVLLGRPYNSLCQWMNKGIPEIFGKLGIAVFYQDMIENKNDGELWEKELLKAFHWKFAAEILDAAVAVARSKDLYPVFITSFKCTPDSYVTEYFKKIMDAHGKPYLILQLDDHDSNVGYETRIEAAVRSFRNHYLGKGFGKEDCSSLSPSVKKDPKILRDKVVLLPRWDSIIGEFMVACLQREGIDARLVEESQESIQRSLSHNTGQCIPLNIIIQNSLDYIQKHNLDPAKTVLWNIDSRISCNLGMFPYYTKTLLESYGEIYKDLEVYAGNITFTEISYRLGFNMYLAYMFGGMLRRMGCKVRPYERVKSTTDSVIDRSTKILAEAFRKGASLEKSLKEVITLFKGIETVPHERPKVAIFGDLYVRDNDIFNQNIISVIEENGGEVITTPYSELIKIIALPYINRWFKEGDIWGSLSFRILSPSLELFERKYYPFFNEILQEKPHLKIPSYKEVIGRFGLSEFHTGESMENILKIYSLVINYPDISLFVQTNPAFCCPSLVTEAMAAAIEKSTGIPVVTIEYDGTGALKNDAVIPYLKLMRKTSILNPKESCA
jgi:predicted CoA-substrate-specific enzyme activase